MQGYACLHQYAIAWRVGGKGTRGVCEPVRRQAQIRSRDADPGSTAADRVVGKLRSRETLHYQRDRLARTQGGRSPARYRRWHHNAQQRN